jgi:hypothetical protein
LQESGVVSNNCKTCEVVDFIRAKLFDYKFKFKHGPVSLEKEYLQRTLDDESVLAEDYSEFVSRVIRNHYKQVVSDAKRQQQPGFAEDMDFEAEVP